ncbi:triphosphoribosyl-dephospho-CoA synthase CitG [Clostridium lundense]|uniref:triphosphoribosyl-dephospho-CoA synthase CitG n=1 Tax=Clostridium lundense TaxID=319475 RepID=UPI000489A5F3|nr:triphosphoribosyl-dephospho-CoA synthase CitG [Clostridium lundense]
MIKNYNINDISFDISSFALQAMLYEVACFPSPGLVSVVSTGAHNDMDHYTFIDSSCSLIKYLGLCCQGGFSDNSPKEILKECRYLGIEAEESMFNKTGGVNTHKGMLFLMGICCIAVGKAIHDNKSFNDIQGIIKEMCHDIVEKELYSLKKYIKDYNSIEEMCQKSELSYGEKLFLLYNMEGIRGEAGRGLPIVFQFALDFYKENEDLSKNDRLIHTLIGIMQYSEDSNILHRHSVETLKEMQEKAKRILKIGGMKTKEGREAIENLDRDFSKRRISPGGSADLLAVTVFFDLVEKYMSEKKF